MDLTEKQKASLEIIKDNCAQLNSTISQVSREDSHVRLNIIRECGYQFSVTVFEDGRVTSTHLKEPGWPRKIA